MKKRGIKDDSKNIFTRVTEICKNFKMRRFLFGVSDEEFSLHILMLGKSGNI